MVVFMFCSPNNWLLHADNVYTHEPTVTQVFAKRFSTNINHRKENITESRLACSFLRIYYFAIVLGLTNNNKNDTAQ